MIGACIFMTAMKLETWCGWTHPYKTIAKLIVNGIYLIGLLYSPRTADAIFFDSLNKNIEKTLDITNNIIFLGDMNEDLLNPYMHNSKDV